VNPETSPAEAGLAALQNDTNYLFLGVRINEGAAHQVFLEQHTQKTIGPELLGSATLPHGSIKWNSRSKVREESTPFLTVGRMVIGLS
jgi:hypothetical protein